MDPVETKFTGYLQNKLSAYIQKYAGLHCRLFVQ
jgi:hypothetical protein